jgi:hypothetical protein
MASRAAGYEEAFDGAKHELVVIDEEHVRTLLAGVGVVRRLRAVHRQQWIRPLLERRS